jgi:hypothetical protein
MRQGSEDISGPSVQLNYLTGSHAGQGTHPLCHCVHHPYTAGPHAVLLRSLDARRCDLFWVQHGGMAGPMQGPCKDHLPCSTMFDQ